MKNYTNLRTVLLIVAILSNVGDLCSQVQYNTHVATSNAAGAWSVYALDKDGDTDIDVLSASMEDDKIAWYRNELISTVPEKENNQMNTQLIENFPNPFTTSTIIKFQVKNYSKVSLMIVDLNGKEVKTLISGFQTPGIKTMIWDASNNSGSSIPSGIYNCRIQIDDNIQSKKIIIAR